MSLVVVVPMACVAMVCAMAGAWAARLATGKSGWIDAIWSGATGLVAAGLALATFVVPGRGIMIAVMALAWGARLGGHLAIRTLRGGDDPRYAELARQWGANFRSRLFWFLQIQALCGFALALSACLAARRPDPFPGVADGLGVAIFLLALLGEAVADRQLAAFRADPRNHGKVCDVGLWGVSRHPNYFFEWLLWMGVAAVALADPINYPFGLLALVAPALMYWLLAHVSGVPPLEEHMLRSRGEAFRAYQIKVSVFFPWPRGGR